MDKSKVLKPKYLWIFELDGEPQWCDGALLILCDSPLGEQGIRECRRYAYEKGKDRNRLIYVPVRFPGDPIPRYDDNSGDKSVWWSVKDIFEIQTDQVAGIYFYAYHDG